LIFVLAFFGSFSKSFAQCPTVTNFNQSFCDTQGGINGPTVSNLVATSNGNGVKWYATATSTTPLLSSVSLLDGEDYLQMTIVVLVGLGQELW